MKDLRDERGLTQEEVADRLELKRRESVTEHETGKSKPSPKTLEKYADLYGISVQELASRQFVREETKESYQAGPLLWALPERPRAIVRGYLDRLRRAGASEEDLRIAESHLASERVRQLSSDGRGKLDDDRLITYIDLTFDAMADLIAPRLGRRP